MSDIPASFPNGLRVFLRSQLPDGSLHNIDFPAARSISRQSDHPLITILDENGRFLGAFMDDAVAGFLPIVIVGPGSDAKN